MFNTSQSHFVIREGSIYGDLTIRVVIEAIQITGREIQADQILDVSCLAGKSQTYKLLGYSPAQSWL